MVDIEELKTILKKTKYTFTHTGIKKKLIDLAIKHGLVAKKAPRRKKVRIPSLMN